MSCEIDLEKFSFTLIEVKSCVSKYIQESFISSSDGKIPPSIMYFLASKFSLHSTSPILLRVVCGRFSILSFVVPIALVIDL